MADDVKRACEIRPSSDFLPAERPRIILISQASADQQGHAADEGEAELALAPTIWGD